MIQSYYDKIIKYNPSPVDFVNKIYKISDDLGIDPIWLSNIINKESGFNPAIKNPSSSASGLIQFIESTAKNLGTSTKELRSMTGVKQLDYVKKYFEKSFRTYGKPASNFEMYLHVFYPPMIGQPLSFQLPEHAYSGNKGIDRNKDGKITKQEIQDWFNSNLPLGAKAAAAVTSGSVLPLIALVGLTIFLAKTLF